MKFENSVSFLLLRLFFPLPSEIRPSSEDCEKTPPRNNTRMREEESRARSFHGIRSGFLRFMEESTTTRSRTTKGGCGVAMVVVLSGGGGGGGGVEKGGRGKCARSRPGE
ncbi:hypothetical protein M0802_005377 [Mischocyttarus mexicanus]|nr:hypothetical protein M0802_005377 [Mischocyttarus mexicanus]